jgi:hypothetical protein
LIGFFATRGKLELAVSTFDWKQPDRRASMTDPWHAQWNAPPGYFDGIKGPPRGEVRN